MIKIKSTNKQGFTMPKDLLITDDQGNKIADIVSLTFQPIKPDQPIMCTVEISVGEVELTAVESNVYSDYKGNKYLKICD